MDADKQSYIQTQENIDYILKSKNSALAFLFVAILFTFINRLEGYYSTYATIIAVGIVALSLLRLLNVNKYSQNKLSIEQSVQIVSYSAVFNAVLWAAIGIISLRSQSLDQLQIIIVFIILISFSAGSIYTLSHKKRTFRFVSVIVLSPQLFYAYNEFLKTNDMQVFWLWAYTAIHIVYNFRQGQTINSELHRRLSFEFDLKKSLEEVALSKKNLEDESIKTFHASRLSSLGEMAGSVAHEINNPLTIIQGMSKSIMSHNDLNLDDEVKTKLIKINNASDRIAKIVKGMKIISSKNDQIIHEVIKVSKVLEVSIGLFEERFKTENIDFKLENSDNPSILCNPLQISQIIINLISNALDALQKDEKNYLRVKVTEDRKNRTVDIRIINNGPLIESAVSAKIFEPFYSTKSLGKGTGLGLSISQTLAHSNGGELSYEPYEEKVCFKLHMNTHPDV